MYWLQIQSKKTIQHFISSLCAKMSNPQPIVVSLLMKLQTNLCIDDARKTSQAFLF